MKIIYELSLKLEGTDKAIFFGIPDKTDELERMFLLREEVYQKKDYINAKSDKDEYDENGKCVYFIAKIEDDIIGTVRLIIDNPLPTQKDCFDFQEPEEMKEIDINKRGELSRLISVPYKKNIYLPRHLVLMFLIGCVFKYSNDNNILGGYSFITTKLYDKINKIKVPFHVIDKYQQKYPTDGLMYPYFSKKDNPIIPIYYNIEEIKTYLEKLFGDRKMFEKINENKFRFKNSLYNKFLKLLKII